MTYENRFFKNQDSSIPRGTLIKCYQALRQSALDEFYAGEGLFNDINERHSPVPTPRDFHLTP
jgi:hypothetical protein